METWRFFNLLQIFVVFERYFVYIVFRTLSTQDMTAHY